MKKAFTLLEILIATGTFMIVMVVAVAIFTITVGGSSTLDQLRQTAQSARFAFESITREVRLSRGLVYVANDLPQMVIPPFVVVQDPITHLSVGLEIYRAQKVDVNLNGESLYSLTKKVYVRDATTKKLTETSYKAYSNPPSEGPQTAKALFDKVVETDLAGNLKGLAGLPWRQVGQSPNQNVLSNQLIADQFTIVRFQTYPEVGKPIDGPNGLTSQPFIQIDLTVSNPQYNQSREQEKQIRTTLRSMIVPRNFVSPLEVVQPGVQ